MRIVATLVSHQLRFIAIRKRQRRRAAVDSKCALIEGLVNRISPFVPQRRLAVWLRERFSLDQD